MCRLGRDNRCFFPNKTVAAPVSVASKELNNTAFQKFRPFGPTVVADVARLSTGVPVLLANETLREFRYGFC